MERNLPPITERAYKLHQRMRQNRHRKQRQHLCMFFLLQGVDHQSLHRGCPTGADHETVSQWLDAYVPDDLAQLLTLYVPRGRPPCFRMPR